MTRTCMCCRSAHTALHAHRPCEMHQGSPVVPLPPPLGGPGGEDCTGPTVRTAVLAAYRLKGGIALELALKQYGHVTHTYKYGTATVEGFEGPWRMEIYRPNDGNRPARERTMVTGPNDDSPRHNKMNYGEGAGYDSRCSCCYLNITHSERKHALCIGTAS